MSQTGEHYDGCKLLSLKDINGKDPGVRISETNRSGGKSTFFGRYLVNRFKNKGLKFGLIYRTENELPGIVDNFFEKELKHLFPQFNNDTMTMEYKERAGFCKLLLNGEVCGFGLALTAARKIRNASRTFIDIDTLFFDEVQLEDMRYGKHEVTQFLSIWKSVARGGGKAVRRVNIIWACNPVSILNPFYVALGIHTRIRQNGEFFRGDGWVLESACVDAVSKQANEDPVARAFSGSKYLEFANSGKHLISDSNFIMKPKGKNRYLCTLRYKGVDYGVREYYDEGVVYVSDVPDMSYSVKIAVTKEDHTINYVMDGMSKMYITMFRDNFELGTLRFKNEESKNAMIDFIAIR